MPRNVATNTHPVSSKARVSEAFIKSPAAITTITMRRARGWLSEYSVAAQLVYIHTAGASARPQRVFGHRPGRSTVAELLLAVSPSR